MALSADLSSDIRSSLLEPSQNSFTVVSSVALYHGALVGLYVSGTNAGLIGPYDDAEEEMIFLGQHVGDQVTAAATSRATTVRVAGVMIDRAVVAGSASSNVGEPVYALSDDPEDLSIAPSTTAGVVGEKVGFLLSQVNSTTWKVVLQSGYLLARFPELIYLLQKVPTLNAATITADGAISLPTKLFSRQVLTGASSAATTLADPGSTTPIGAIIEIVRLAGTGTHDVDYTDFSSGADAASTATLEAGQRVVLQAIDSNGWRRLI